MYDRLLEFLNKHKIFNKFQFGFRYMHSTFMALITLLDNLRNALDSGNCALGIFLDFQKALDTVNYRILLGKLNCYGIRGIALDWFSSYLTNRSQTVIYNEHESVTVPCQSIDFLVLNSVLHCVRYVHSIALVAEKKGNHILYAIPQELVTLVSHRETEKYFLL